MNRTAAALLCLVMAPLSAWAADPPGRVARVSLVEGEAAVFADPEQGWEGARVNDSLTSENSVWTEPGARVEVRFGSTALRLAETTQLDILRLDDQSFRAHVARGTLAIRIREFDGNESYAIDTPQARFQLRSSGRYRIDADPGRGESVLTVFAGNARLEAEGGYISIDTGRSVRVTGGERPRYAFEIAGLSELDDWALARDQRFEQREAARYVPPQMTGWEELDDYGVWRNEAEYGAVWFPTRIEAGWAPYRHGRWTWVRPWGWTWVDDAPWGYAPFHYGRWVVVGNRWGWYPGRYTSRPVWAPALVGWVGRPGWSISISTRPTDVVGWYPLSPYDRYQPWYTSNVTYVNNVNRIVVVPRRNGDHRDNRYDNRERGATVVPREHFGSRRPVQSVRAPVSREVVTAQPIVSGSSVLPSHNEWRARSRATEGAQPQAVPRASPGGEPVARQRPAYPQAPVPGAPSTRPITPSTKPMASTPVVPAAPAAPTSRLTRPAPAEPAQQAKPPEAPTRQKPAQPQPQSSGRPAPAQPQPQSSGWPAPAQPQLQPSTRPTQPQSQPSERSTPAQPQSQPSGRSTPPQPHAQPSGRPEPAQPQAKPSARQAPTQPQSQAQPSARPAPAQPQPSAKPAPAPDKPARSTDKPDEKPSERANPKD